MDILKPLLCFKDRPFDHPIKDFVILIFLIVLLVIFAIVLTITLGLIPVIGQILAPVIVVSLILVSSPIILMYAFRTIIAILVLILQISGRKEEQLNSFQDSLDICTYLPKK